ncbi:MAG: VanW family protein [Clostridia bacterium]
MEKKRKLFCEISPFTYKLSSIKCQIVRKMQDIFSKVSFAKQRQKELLPIIIYSSKSLIRRKLGNVDMQLQENKALNLKLATRKLSGIIIKPGEVFSFWHLVGSCNKAKGYQAGLLLSNGKATSGIGGGMCQLTNLIHWLILHTPLEIVEHHHHDGLDMFPDYGRQIPFGTGTSIAYNYLDYRFMNPTEQDFQVVVATTDKYLCGEIRANKPLSTKYHIKVEDEYFSKEDDGYYRNGKILRETLDCTTGNILSSKLIKKNHAKLMYDSKYIGISSKNSYELKELS